MMDEPDFWDPTATLNELLAGRNEAEYFQSQWGQIRWQNVPGVFYTGDTDTCETGYPEAPANVLFNADGQEFIAIQPRDRAEVEQVLRAAQCEAMTGYARDGNDYWTLERIRAWWSRRDELLHFVREQRRHQRRAYFAGYQDALARFEAFIHDGMREYLRCYAWFLEQRQHPYLEPNLLPEID